MKKFTPKAFIFDVDGTLVPNMSFHTQIWMTFLAKMGVQIDPDEFHHQTAGKTSPEVIRLMLGGHLSDGEVRQLSEQKESFYRESYRPLLQAVPGLHNFLAQAHQQGLPMAIASAGGPRNIGFVLDGLQIRDYFQAVVSGEDVKNGKPHPDLFLTAAERLGVAPANCLVFEDARLGIEAARRAGMRAVLITTTLKPEVIEDWSGIETAVPDFSALHIMSLMKGEGTHKRSVTR